MATTNGLNVPFKSFELGLDVDTPIGSDELIGTLSEATNCVIAENDLAVTRPGYSYLTSVVSGFIPREGISYVDATGNRMEIIWVESTTPTGFTSRLYKLDGAVLTLLLGGLPDGIKPSMVQAGNLLFIFNGTADYVYDGTTLRQIGITEPVNAPTDNANIVGGMTAAATYLYAYTYYNINTGAESSPSPASAIITIGVGGGRRINLTAGSAATATHIKIYRTLNGQGTFYFDDMVVIGAITFDSINSDAALGQELELDNSRLPEAASYATILDNRIFVAGFASNPCRVMYSKIGINGPMFESFQVADLADCNNADGDSIIGLNVVGSSVAVLKNRSFGTLLSIDTSSTGLERWGYQKYLYNEVSREISGVSHHTMIPIRGNLMWLGKTNIYLTDGAKVIPVANRIKSIVRALNFTKSYKFSIINDYNSVQHIVISVCKDANTEPNHQIVGRYTDFPRIDYTLYSPGPDTATHPGIPAACMWHTVQSGVDTIWFGGNDLRCRLYEWDPKSGTNTNDDDFPIYFRVKTPWQTGDEGTKMKSFKAVHMLVYSVAQVPNNTLLHTWEEDGEERILKSSTSTLLVPTVWGGGLWGSFIWASAKYTICKFFPNRKALLGRYGLVQDKLNSPLAVKALRFHIKRLLE